MAIGKPLLITEKKTVQTPVLSAQTTPLSANVAAQKLSFADYGIGQANAKASFAVSNELVGMAEAVGKAAIYIDKTKKEHARLDMMQAWQQTDMTFAEDYAEAVTYREKNEVAARYQESIGTRSRAYRDIGNFNLEAQKSLAALTGKSRSQLSKMHISSAQTLVSETQSGYKLQESKITDEIKANPTVDMGVKFQEYRDLQNKMVDIGMKTTQQAEFDQIQWQRGAHSIRGAVIGKEYAKSYISDGSPLPDDNEILQHYMDRTGMGLDDISSKAYVESVHDTYSKKVRQFNTEARAERLLIENSFYDEKKENDRLLKEAIVSNELTDEAVQTFMAIAESFGSAYAGEVQAQIDAYKYGSADANVVDLYSNDEAVQGYIDSGYLQNQFIDVDSVISSLPSEVNVSERAAIARKLITRNKEISTDIAKQIPTTASGVLTEIFHPDNPLGERFRALVGDKLAVELSRGLASGKLNWKEVIGSDKDFGAIWNGVNAAVKDYYEKGKGKADPEYMKSRTNIERYEDLRSVLEKEFNSAIEDKLDFLQKKKDAVDLEKEKQLEAERRAGEEKAERDVEREIEKGKERSEKEAQEVMEKVHKTQLIEAQNRLVEYAKQLNALPRVMTDLPEKPPEKNGRQDYLDYWFGGKNWKPDLSKESGEPIDSGSPVGLSQDQLSEMQVTHEAVRVGGELLSGFSQQTPILDGPKESKENFGGMAGENQVAPPEGEQSQEQSTVAEQVSQFVGDAIDTVAEVLSPSVANAEEVPPPNVPVQPDEARVPQDVPISEGGAVSSDNRNPLIDIIRDPNKSAEENKEYRYRLSKVIDEELNKDDRKLYKGLPYHAARLGKKREDRGISNISQVEAVDVERADGSTVLATNLTVGYGHDVTVKELNSGKIHGVKFLNEDGSFIDLDNGQLTKIFMADIARARGVVESEFKRRFPEEWGLKLDDLPSSLKDFLIDIEFNTGALSEYDKTWGAMVRGALYAHKGALTPPLLSGLIKTLKREIRDRRGAKKRADRLANEFDLDKAIEQFFVPGGK